MLIITNRHTKKDFDLWRKYEEADSIKCGFIDGKIQRSVHAIKQFLLGGDCYFTTSWGKDSVTVIHIAYTILGNNLKVWNIRVSPNRNPYCDKVRDMFLSMYKINYFEIIADYSDVISRHLTPSEYNKETDKIWHASIKEISLQSGTIRHCLGIRADESNVRLLRCMRWNNNSPNSCAPLAWWKAEDVFAYLYKYDLPVHPNYAMLGNGRWDRNKLRVAEIGDSHGRGIGRDEWEKEYYPELLRKIEANVAY